jgi:DNA polymerase I-like protein with 3'-5' exonuclease and polymerase domains
MIVRTRPEWLHVVSKLKNSFDKNGVRVISYDWETVDRTYPDIQHTGFSVGWHEGGQIRGAYIPVGHNTGELQLHIDDVATELAEVLEDPSIQIAMQNAPYDMKVSTLVMVDALSPSAGGTATLTKRGIKVHDNIFDTMVASWLLNTNGVGTKAAVLAGHGSHGLKDQARYVLKMEMRDLADFAPKEKQLKNGVEIEVMRTDLVKIEDLGDYAADDAIATLALRDHYLPLLEKEPKVQKVMQKLERPFAHCLTEMEMNGIELQDALLVEMRTAVEDELVDIRRKMYEQREGQDFHAIRDVALVKKLAVAYEELDAIYRLPQDDPRYPKNEKGKPAGKGTVRKKLIASSGLEGHPVVEKIRDDKLRPEIAAYPHLAHQIFAIGSNIDLNRVLFDECRLPPIGERGVNGLYSTAAENIDEWAKESELAQLLQRFREIEKLRGTYLVGMVGKLGPDNRLRTSINRTGTRTGRLSTRNPNLQNIPTSSEFPIRKAFVGTGTREAAVTVIQYHLDKDGKQERPRELICENGGGGYHIKDGSVVDWWGDNPPWPLFVADYSQLEICLLAHVSKDPTLVQAVTAGEDIHALTAQACFDEVPKDISLAEVAEFYPKQRKNAKPVNFGIIYGMGPPALAAALNITEAEAEELINERYMKRFPGVADYIDRMHAMAKQFGYVVTAIGRKRHLPAAMLDPRERGNRSLISQACRQAQNAPIQGFAADVVAMAMVAIREFFMNTTVDVNNPAMFQEPCDMRGGSMRELGEAMWKNHMRMLIQVHDELVQEAHPAVANYMMAETVRIMENAVKLRVPLRVSAALGTDWYNTKE